MLFTKLYDVVLLDDGRPDIIKRKLNSIEHSLVMRGVSEEIESMVEGIKRRQTARKTKVQGIEGCVDFLQILKLPIELVQLL